MCFKLILYVNSSDSDSSLLPFQVTAALQAVWKFFIGTISAPCCKQLASKTYIQQALTQRTVVCSSTTLPPNDSLSNTCELIIISQHHIHTNPFPFDINIKEVHNHHTSPVSTYHPNYLYPTFQHILNSFSSRPIMTSILLDTMTTLPLSTATMPVRSSVVITRNAAVHGTLHSTIVSSGLCESNFLAVCMIRVVLTCLMIVINGGVPVLRGRNGHIFGLDRRFSTSVNRNISGDSEVPERGLGKLDPFPV